MNKTNLWKQRGLKPDFPTLLKPKLALKHEYPVYIVLKIFSLGSSES